jgi:hypothetical protein
MSPSESRNGREVDSIPEGGILAALPRARPQRASARRTAARTSTAAKKGTTAAAKTATATKTKSAQASRTKKHVARESPAVAEPSAAKKPTARKSVAVKKAASTKRRRTKPIAKPTEPPAPKQGYEPEEELELGKSVNPPSGAELVESVADIIGELANSGLTAGGRLLKDAFSLLRRP